MTSPPDPGEGNKGKAGRAENRASLGQKGDRKGGEQVDISASVDMKRDLSPGLLAGLRRKVLTVVLAAFMALAAFFPPGASAQVAPGFLGSERWTSQSQEAQVLRQDLFESQHGVRVESVRAGLVRLPSIFGGGMISPRFVGVPGGGGVAFAVDAGLMSDAAGLNGIVRQRLGEYFITETVAPISAMSVLLLGGRVVAVEMVDQALELGARPVTTVVEMTKLQPRLVSNVIGSRFGGDRGVSETGGYEEDLELIAGILDVEAPEGVSEVVKTADAAGRVAGSSQLSGLALQEMRGLPGSIMVVNVIDLSASRSLIREALIRRGEESEGVILAVVTDESLMGAGEIEGVLSGLGLEKGRAVVLSQSMVNGKFNLEELIGKRENRRLFTGRTVLLVNVYGFWQGIGKILQVVFKPIGTQMGRWLEKVSGIALSRVEREKLRGEFREAFDLTIAIDHEMREVRVLQAQQ